MVHLKFDERVGLLSTIFSIIPSLIFPIKLKKKNTSLEKYLKGDS